MIWSNVGVHSIERCLEDAEIPTQAVYWKRSDGNPVTAGGHGDTSQEPVSILELQRVTKTFSRGKQEWRAVKDISFLLRRGDAVALVGGNGAGKTTLVRLIAGILAPDLGSISIGGMPLRGYSSTAQRIGVISEGARDLYGNLTVLENIEYFGMLRGMKRSRAQSLGTKICASLGLQNELSKFVRILSRGNRQRTAIAATLLFSPDLLVMDEPTLGMDIEARRQFADTIGRLRSMGLTLLLATHDLDMAEQLCDRALVLNSGELRYDGPIKAERSTADGTDNYEIILAGPLANAASVFGAHVSDNGVRITVSCTPDGLYDLLERIKPAEILTVQKSSWGIKDIFEKYGGHAGS